MTVHTILVLGFDAVKLFQVLQVPQNNLSGISNTCSYRSCVAVDSYVMCSKRVCTAKLMRENMLGISGFPELDA
jgi:hypothetical protein